jgi:hypothetical protein
MHSFTLDISLAIEIAFDKVLSVESAVLAKVLYIFSATM